jgi:hypothetical protein
MRTARSRSAPMLNALDLNLVCTWRQLMSELVADLPYRVIDADGNEYYVSVGAEPRKDGRWEAWLEYMPLDESEPFLTPTETTQQTRAEVMRWAEALTETYVQGAFRRAMSAAADVLPALRERRTAAEAAAEAAIEAVRGDVPDPFAMYERGRPAMTARLGTLPSAVLRQIISEFGLNPAGKSLSWLNRNQLVTFIITAVEVQTAMARRDP